MADSESLTQRMLLMKVEAEAKERGLLDTATILTLLESNDPLIRLDTIRMFERVQLPSEILQNKIILMLSTDDNSNVRLGVIAFIGRRYSLDERKKMLGTYTDSVEFVNRFIQTYLSPQA